MSEPELGWWVVVHRSFNALEALFWLVVGAGFVVRAFRRPSALPRRLLFVAGVACIAFGGSDVVEIRTGTWFRPWWLLAWNVACVVTLIACLVWYRNVKRVHAGG